MIDSNYYSDLRLKSYFDECLSNGKLLSVDPDIWPRVECLATPKDDSAIYFAMGMHDKYSKYICEDAMELIVSVEKTMSIQFLSPNAVGGYSEDETTIAKISSGIQDLHTNEKRSFLGYDLADQYLSSILYYSVSELNLTLSCNPYGLLQNINDALHLRNILNSGICSCASEHLPVYIYGLYVHSNTD